MTRSLSNLGRFAALVLCTLAASDAAAFQVTPYGSGINPPGSLTVLAGQPVLGGSITFGVSNPAVAVAPVALSLLAIATAPDAAYPFGTVLPGYGLSVPGGLGELLVSFQPPNPIVVLGPQLWNGAGGPPSPFVLPLPLLPALAGATLYFQGALITPQYGFLMGVTNALEARFLPLTLPDMTVVQWDTTGPALLSVNTAQDEAVTLYCERDAAGLPLAITGASVSTPEVGAAEVQFDAMGRVNEVDLIGAGTLRWDYSQLDQGIVQVTIQDAGASTATQYLIDVVSSSVIGESTVEALIPVSAGLAPSFPVGRVELLCGGSPVGPPLAAPSGQLIQTTLGQVNFNVPLANWTWEPGTLSWRYAAPIQTKAPWNCGSFNDLVNFICPPGVPASVLPLTPLCAYLGPLSPLCIKAIAVTEVVYQTTCVLDPGCDLIGQGLQFAGDLLTDNYLIAVKSTPDLYPQGNAFQQNWNPALGAPQDLQIALPVATPEACNLGDIQSVSGPAAPPKPDPRRPPKSGQLWPPENRPVVGGVWDVDGRGGAVLPLPDGQRLEAREAGRDSSPGPTWVVVAAHRRGDRGTPGDHRAVLARLGGPHATSPGASAGGGKSGQ